MISPEIRPGMGLPCGSTAWTTWSRSRCCKSAMAGVFRVDLDAQAQGFEGAVGGGGVEGDGAAVAARQPFERRDEVRQALALDAAEAENGVDLIGTIGVDGCAPVGAAGSAGDAKM